MPDNITTLQNAGLLDSSAQLTQDQEDAINSLSTEEVDHMISSHQKLKDDFNIGEAQPMIIV